MKRMFVYPLVLFVVASSCKKEKEPEPFVVSKETIAGNYTLTAATANGTDVYNNPDPNLNAIKPCMKDDVHLFKADLTYEVVDRGDACTPSTDHSGTWKFIDHTKMEVDGVPTAIKSFDGKKLVLAGDGGGVTIEITFTKQ